MAEREDDPPITEPVVAQDIFATGVSVESINGEFRITAWVDVSDERRIVARLVLPDKVARDLSKDLRKALSKGGH